MSLTPSSMIPLGTKAPDFTLLDVASGKHLTLSELKSDIATVIMFICNHCPYVKHIQQGLVELTKEYEPKGISFIGISSNDVENYPEDSPEKMKDLAEKLGFNFPYLYDETQEVAKSYDAQCTPDFFIYDKDLNCAYRGQLDDSRPGNNIPVTGNDIKQALNSLIEGKTVSGDQKASIGCNIKWK
ncbi:MAG: thioredoxin family protein [Candidatus Caenarcaniphilales bacterium]|nr:thioredoxin family protein [Candidatus Caenarcaniphilales bacterium]